MRRLTSALVVTALLAAFGILSWMAAVGDSQTSDEAVHLAAGLSYLKTGDYRMNPEHPPLAKLIDALPLVFTGATLPLEHPSWKAGQEWSFGVQFLYRNQITTDRLLAAGRFPNVILALLLLWLIYRWSGSLYGKAGALLSLVLAAFEPNLLAHSHYVTNDVPITLAFTATLYAAHCFRRSEHQRWLLAVGLFLGASLGTKYSGLLLLPLLPFALWPEPARAATRPARLRTTIGRLLVVGLVAYGLLAAVYQGEPLRRYLDGLEHMQGSWSAFLLGDISTHGWFHYFGIAFLLKTPPGTVVILILTALSLRRHALRPGEGILVLSALWLFLISSYLRINIGIRHLLPVYPLLFILAGRTLSLELQARTTSIQRRLVPLLACCTVIESTASFPSYLSYFSSLVGGSAQGYRYLSDSNLDWGQDMKRLAEWVQGQRLEGILLGTFFGGDPGAYGLRYQAMPGVRIGSSGESPLESLPARLYVAASAMNLQGVYFAYPEMFKTRVPVNRDIYKFLLDRPPTVRLTPSIWIWDISRDADLIYRLGMMYLNFSWNRSATSMFDRYLALRPDDARARRGLEQLKAQLTGGTAGPVSRDTSYGGGADADPHVLP